MSKKLSIDEVLRLLVERVRRVEREAVVVATVLERMIADIEKRRAAAGEKARLNSGLAENTHS